MSQAMLCRGHALTPSQANGSDALEETLGRVAKKSGVKATIVLDRATGTILKTSGQISSIKVAKPLKTGPTDASSGPVGVESNVISSDEPQGAEQLSAMVWSFVNAAGTLVQDIDGDVRHLEMFLGLHVADELRLQDELRLLRLRTKKQELVIVPDPKYLLIVIHDTPPA